MSMEQLKDIRDRVLPMMQIVVEQYAGRVPAGYPNIIDNVEQGAIGLEIDPSFALHFTSDDDGLYAEVYKRLPRTDSRATAGRQKYAGTPLADRRPLSAVPTDEELRNLIAELKNAYNFQPGLLYITED